MNELKLFSSLSFTERSKTLNEIAKLYMNEWGKYQEGKDLDWWVKYITDSVQPGGEIVCLFSSEKKLLGCVSLKPKNMEDEGNFNDLTPWLSGMIIIPEERGNGFSILLGRKLMECAQQRGHKTVFLFSHNLSLVTFYERFGCDQITQRATPLTYKGDPIVLLQGDVSKVIEKCNEYLELVSAKSYSTLRM